MPKISTSRDELGATQDELKKTRVRPLRTHDVVRASLTDFFLWLSFLFWRVEAVLMVVPYEMSSRLDRYSKLNSSAR